MLPAEPKTFGWLTGLSIAFSVLTSLLIWLAMFLGLFLGYFTFPLLILALFALLNALVTVGLFFVVRRREKAREARIAALRQESAAHEAPENEVNR